MAIPIRPAFALASYVKTDSVWSNHFQPDLGVRPLITVQQIPDQQKYDNVIVFSDTGYSQYSDRLNDDQVQFQIYVRNCKANDAYKQGFGLMNYFNSLCDLQIHLDTSGGYIDTPKPTDDYYIRFNGIYCIGYANLGLNDQKHRQWSFNFSAFTQQSADRNRF